MRSGLLVRGVALAVVVCVVACCSSGTDVTAFNESTQPIELDVLSEEGRSWRGTLQPGESAEVWLGFGGPKRLEFVVDGKRMVYDQTTMPPGLARATSGGAEAHWRWRGRNAVFEVPVPSRLDRWFRQMLALGCVGMLVVGAIAWYVRRLWIQGSPEAQRRNLR